VISASRALTSVSAFVSISIVRSASAASRAACLGLFLSRICLQLRDLDLQPLRLDIVVNLRHEFLPRSVSVTHCQRFFTVGPGRVR